MVRNSGMDSMARKQGMRLMLRGKWHEIDATGTNGQKR